MVGDRVFKEVLLDVGLGALQEVRIKVAVAEAEVWCRVIPDGI